MWTYTQGCRVAVTFLAFTVIACGDDSDGSPWGDLPEAGQPTVRDGDGGLLMDAAVGLDASHPDATTGQPPTDGAAPDGSVVVLPDGAVVVVPVGSLDAATQNDATTADAARDARVGCDVTDSRYGCGTELSANWLRFASGLEIDRNYERAWSPIFDVLNMDDLATKCAALTLPGVPAGQFKVPAITDVRTLAAGCQNTVLTSNACDVTSGNVLPSNAGTCGCDPVGNGPNNGKFCRADVPDCVTLWTQTVCGVSVECPMPQIWLYDVATGSVVHTPEFDNSALRSTAKGRCFAGIAGQVP